MVADAAGNLGGCLLEIAPDHRAQRIYVKYPAEADYFFVEQRFTREP